MSSQPSDQNAAPPPASQNLSNLLARILDQLSLSAWLPAGVLVFGLLLIGELHIHGGHPIEAFRGMASLEPMAVVLLVMAVVLATTLTQAFEFEVIQFLEGYWGHGRRGSQLLNRGAARSIRRRNEIRADLDLLMRDAFESAIPGLRRLDVTPAVIDILRKDLDGEADDDAAEVPLEVDQQLADEHFDWLVHAEPDLRRRIDSLRQELRRYPKLDHLVLPTKLGNTLRAHEQRVSETLEGHRDSGLHGYVYEVFDRLPGSIQIEHDQYRSRLDLYCSLTLVCLVLAAVAGVVLAFENAWLAVGAFVAGVTLGWVSYRAAVTSARGYGLVLEQVAQRS